jgi:hypothetical protein
VLLDLGRVPVGEFSIEIIVSAALAGNALIDGASAIRSPEWTINDISFEVLELSVAFAVFVQGILKRSVRERGIFHGTGLITWERIEGYSWEGLKGDSQTLVLQKQSSVALLRTVTLSVKSEQVEAVEQHLRGHNIVSASETLKGTPGNP